MVGRDLDARYLVGRRIGRGGMGSVYEATQSLMERQVALKVVHPEIASELEIVQRFLREARALGRLRHPNTVTVYEVDRASDGTLFMAMELLQGPTLSELMSHGPMDPWRVTGLALQACRSLSEAHRAGMVHRDLKPDNLMVCRQPDGGDHLVVLDFGLVKLFDHPNLMHLTKTGTAVGTPGYMSPEAMAKDVGPAADLYSLGCLMFQALTGRPPFRAKAPVGLVMKHINDPVPAMADVAPGVFVPPLLEDVVRRLLEKQPEARYPSADAVMEVLNSTLAQAAFAATQPDDVGFDPG